MSASFKAALGALNLSYATAAAILSVRETALTDMVRGKIRVPTGVWEELGDLFEQIEAAADEIISDQGEKNPAPHVVNVAEIELSHRALRAAAAARAMLVIGPELLTIVDEASDG